MTLRLYDTAARAVRDFVPLEEGRAGIYVCGLTKMVSEVRRVAKQQLGYDRRAIHSERYD